MPQPEPEPDGPSRVRALDGRRGPSALPGVVAFAIVALLLGMDRLPRFYQGDSTAYLATGLNGWVPLDRSWAYGYGARWLVSTTHTTVALVAMQVMLLLGGILLLTQMVSADRPRWCLAGAVFAAMAALDPLNETYSRFWLSDVPAAAAFVGFVTLLATSLTTPARHRRLLLLLLAAVILASVFIRVAYAPIEVGALLISALAASWAAPRDRAPGLRRRLLALITLPVLAVGILAAANSQVATLATRGQIYVNRMSKLYTMGVFLPALQREDFARAGIPLTQAEFDRLDTGRYEYRERQVWADGPQYVRWLMQRKLGVDDVYDARFQGACAAVVRSALLHHPRTLVVVYLRSLALYFSPTEWSSGFRDEMGFGKPLPTWAASYLSQLTGRAVPPSITDWSSPLPAALGAVINLYPILLLFGAAVALLVLAQRARPFGTRHVVAAAVLSLLLVTPLFSHIVKPRYMLATVTLCEALLTLTLFNASTMTAVHRTRRVAVALLRLVATTPALPAMVALLCVAVYAGQLGLGRWQSDEFSLFANQRDWGWRVLAARLLYTSRPFSEGVLFLYGQVVTGLGRPLIVPFLAALWTGLLAALALAARSVLPPSPTRWSTTLALAATPLAFVLATNNVTETFYWPAAAAAYLPVGGAATVLLFLLSGPLSRRRRFTCGTALLVAATSSEVGAALAVAFAGAAAIEAGSRPRTDRIAIRSEWRIGMEKTVREGAWWIIPGLVGLSVLAMASSLHLTILEPGSDAQPYTSQIALSAGTVARRLALDFLRGEGPGGGLAMLGGLAAKLLFALSFVLIWRGAADRTDVAPGRWQAVLAASLTQTALFSMAASYYHYDAPCCERDITMRSWLVDLLAILAMAWALARWCSPTRGGGGWRHRTGWVPPFLLTVSLFPVAFRVYGLHQGYDNLHLAVTGLERTWRSGRQADTERMEFYLPPDTIGSLVRGTAQPAGTFRTGEPDTPEMVTELGRFFGKGTVTVCQPWQNEKSWLIRGQFIPACPPHDGPPDRVIP